MPHLSRRLPRQPHPSHPLSAHPLPPEPLSTHTFPPEPLSTHPFPREPLSTHPSPPAAAADPAITPTPRGQGRSHRRGLRAIAAALGLALGITAAPLPGTSLPEAQAVDPLPTFTYTGRITTGLSYDPTGEFIFPSVFHAGEYLDDPLGEWYLYYAPHENPGGISLMYADSLDGPWTEYASNPLVSSVWQPYYSVNHVSSPDVIWNAQEGQVFLYFHGGNDQTRYATSADGVSFTYGGTAVTNAMGGTTTTETSYARVFEHPDPTSAYQYGMFYMENTTANSRRIRVAESVDGRTWTVRPTPVVTPGSADAGNVSAANLWEWGGQLYVIYHASSKKIFARTIDPTLTQVGAPVVLYQSSGAGTDVGRAASPEIVTADGATHLFYEQGDRLDATIAHAVQAAPPAAFALDIAATATSSCSGGTARITVDAHNRSTASADIRITTPLGERKYTGVGAGAHAVPVFTGTATSLAAGPATVKGFARVNGTAYEQTWTVPYPAVTC